MRFNLHRPRVPVPVQVPVHDGSLLHLLALCWVSSSGDQVDHFSNFSEKFLASDSAAAASKTPEAASGFKIRVNNKSCAI